MDLEIYKINKAYAAVSELANIKLPIKIAWELSEILNELSEKVKFAGEQEQKIIKSYEGEFDGEGRVRFKSDDIAVKCAKELNDLHMTVLSCNFNKLKISFADIPDCKIEAKNIADLKDIIEFK